MSLDKHVLEHEITLDFLRKNIGEQAVPIIKYYARTKRELLDEELAKKFKIKVTEVRTILNRFHYRGIADYSKTRNKRTGWYTYAWHINENRIIELLLQEQQEIIRKLEAEKSKLAEFALFACKSKCEEMAFEIAIQYNFQCQVCGNTMNGINQKSAENIIKKQFSATQTFIDQLRNAKQKIKK